MAILVKCRPLGVPMMSYLRSLSSIDPLRGSQEVKNSDKKLGSPEVKNSGTNLSSQEVKTFDKNLGSREVKNFDKNLGSKEVKNSGTNLGSPEVKNSGTNLSSQEVKTFDKTLGSREVKLFDKNLGSREVKHSDKNLGSQEVKKNRLLEFVESHERLTADEWRRHKSAFRTPASFESQVMCWCAVAKNLTLGRSLAEFMRSDGVEPNLVTMSKYLRLLGDCRVDQPDAVDEDELLELYSKIVEGRHMIFDVGTTEDLIHGVCSTSRWRESTALLDAIAVSSVRFNSHSLLRVAMAAFGHREFDLGWELMAKAEAGNNVAALDGGYREWIRMCRAAPPGERSAMMERMLGFLRKHEIFVSENVARDISACFESQLEDGWKGCMTTVSTSGTCRRCHSPLESIVLSREQFSELRVNFIRRVVEGKDVFLKSTPSELGKFEEFVARSAPYDVVLDGLNVAYASRADSGDNAKLAKQLLTVVHHFVDGIPNCRILILGRRHMLKWPQRYLSPIRRMALFFCVEDLSKDDPYLIYAAMQSGQGTMLISKDMMRDHLFCLRDPALASSFRRWLRGHQMEIHHVKPGGEVVFKPTLTHNPVVQGDALRWHIPFDNGGPRPANEAPNTWLCLRKIAGSAQQ